MLTTRCPHCGTAFRVKPEQLRARGGRVRCGHCQAPFSALESLIDTPDEETVTPLQREPAPEPPATKAPETPAADPQDFELAAPAALPVTRPPVNDPFSTTWIAPPRRPQTLSTSPRDIAPPMPELDPSAAHAPIGSHLDFDLDAPHPDDPYPTETESFLPARATPEFREADDNERTALSWDWRVAETGADTEIHSLDDDEPSEQHTPPPFRADPPPFRADPPPFRADPPPEPVEPVFVTAFANPVVETGPDARQEPVFIDDSEDTIFEAPESLIPPFEPPAPKVLPEPAVAAVNPIDDEPVDAPHFSWDQDSRPAPRSWTWTFGILLLLLAGIAQAALWLRHDIARDWPQTRPLFETACVQLGCAMPWPRVTSQISIEASDLHPRAGHPGTFELVGTLRNRAEFAQAYPHLEITLTDTFNRALVRKVLPPEQWLPAALQHSESFDAASDIGFSVNFEATEQPAAGYKLYAFYP